MKAELITKKFVSKALNNNVLSSKPCRNSYPVNRDITKEIAENSDRFIKTLINLGKNNGEILNILVTAFGTALVAPIFIAFNPLSKEDKDTKTYSAMRQPISAAIAVATQVGIVIKFNKWLDQIASEGILDRANLSAKPQVSFLKRIIKLEKPHLDKQGIIDEVEKRQDKAFWKTVNKLRKDYKGKNISYASLVDPTKYKNAQKTVEKELQTILTKYSKKDAKKVLAAETLKKASAQVEKELKKEANIKFKMVQISQNAQKKGVSFEKVIKKLELQRRKAKGEQAEIISEVIEKFKTIGNLTDIKNHGKDFEEVLQSVKIKKLVKVNINNAEEVLKNAKKWGGLGLALLTLPVSCGILNWAYPRLMEKLMPEISSAKKLKEANK